jgi:hypothetical protein
MVPISLGRSDSEGPGRVESDVGTFGGTPAASGDIPFGHAYERWPIAHSRALARIACPAW